jgi:hypothetical protein
MASGLFLGICKFTPRPFTRVEAIAQADQGGWRVGDLKKVLPHEGQAFAPSLPGFGAGHYLAFRVVPKVRIDTKKDQFLVSDPMPVAEVWDYRDREPELARRALVEQGVTSLLLGTKDIIVALPDRVCTVVHMVKHPTTDLFVADLRGIDHLPTFVFDNQLFQGAEIGERYIAVPGATVGPRRGALDWRPDPDFLDWLLKRLRKQSEQSPISRAQIPRVVGYLMEARLLPSTGQDLVPAIARFRSFSRDLGANQAAVAEIVDVLSALRPVQAGLEDRRTEAYEELKRELEPRVRAELKDALADLAEARAKLSEEIRTLEADVERAKGDAESAEATSRALLNGLTEELAALQVELGAVPEASTLTVAALARRLGERLAEAGRPIELVPNPAPPWSRPAAGQICKLVPWSEVDATLAVAANAAGFLPDELGLADVAARAGIVLLLPQEGAFDFVRCYASVVAGAAVVHEALHPAVISLDDLWRLPGSGATTGFARAWTAARLDPRRYRVVLLEGLQRTPSDLWAPSLADVLAGRDRPANLLIFASLDEGFLDPERVWAGLGKVFPAFAPSPRTAVNSELVDRVAGQTLSANWLDAGAAPRPDKAEIVAHINSLADESNASQVDRSLALFNAARAREPAGAASQIARRFGEGEGRSPPLKRGAVWIRDVLASRRP